MNMIGGTLEAELKRTAELLVEIVNHRDNGGVYFAVAFLYDSGYDLKRIHKLLPILRDQAGAITRRN